jgi:hypothetical protein
MYVNAKMIPVEPVPGIGGGGMKERNGGGEYIVRIFENATMYPHPAEQNN